MVLWPLTTRVPFAEQELPFDNQPKHGREYEDNPEESSYGEEDYEQALRTIKDIEGGTFEVDEDELDERYQTEAQEWISDKIDEIRQIELNV